MKGKWKDNRGETLVEVLASVLIGALSVALLFSAVMASFNMDQKAEEVDGKFGESLTAAEAQSPGDSDHLVSDKKVTVKNKSGVAISEEVPVNFYGGDGAWSYALPEAAPVTPP